MTQYLYKSQKKEYKRKTKTISDDLKKTLDKAVFECVYKDHRSFNDFEKPGYFFSSKFFNSYM